MTGEWQHYNSSKYEAKCDYCKRDIHTSEGRWVQKKADGRGRWNACHNCIAPPTREERSPPPLGGETPSVTPKIDSPACPQTPSPPERTPTASSREDAIAAAHRENMESAKATRNCIVLLVAAIEESNKIHAKRNELLSKKVEA